MTHLGRGVWGVITKHNLHITLIDNTKMILTNNYIRTRIILHTKAKDMSLEICARFIAALFHMILVHIHHNFNG